MLFRLAWRNIWRNKRRTLITLASILFAVLLSSFMESLQKGAWNNMINNVVNFHTGYIQVHQKGFWEEQSLDYCFPLVATKQPLKQSAGVSAVVPRLESFALASTGANTMGVMVTGIDPVVENAMTGLKERLTAGDFLQSNSKKVLIAAGIAENLKLKVGDTLLMISQGYHGVNAAGKYPVAGIVHYPSPELNRLLVFLALPEAQWFYGAEGMITSLVIRPENPKKMNSTLQSLHQAFPASTYEIMDWKELLPDLLEAKKIDSAGNVIVYIILYMIIAFGLLGTILMMVRERQYEFGLLLAIGMKRWLLGIVVWLEVMILGILGALAGIVVSMPLVVYFRDHPIRFSGDYSAMLEQFGFEPIFPAEFSLPIFFTQALVTLIITTVLAAVPLVKILHLQVIAAMRS